MIEDMSHMNVNRSAAILFPYPTHSLGTPIFSLWSPTLRLNPCWWNSEVTKPSEKGPLQFRILCWRIWWSSEAAKDGPWYEFSKSRCIYTWFSQSVLSVKALVILLWHMQHFILNSREFVFWLVVSHNAVPKIPLALNYTASVKFIEN